MLAICVISGVGGPAYTSDTKRRKSESVVSCSIHLFLSDVTWTE